MVVHLCTYGSKIVSRLMVNLNTTISCISYVDVVVPVHSKPERITEVCVVVTSCCEKLKILSQWGGKVKVYSISSP